MDQIDETKLRHGALDRPEDYGKAEAPSHSEIAGAAAPAVWVEKDPTTGFKTYPKRNQAEADDCVSYAYAKAIGVDFLNLVGVYRDLSPHSLYCMTFVTGGGSDSISAGSVVTEFGMTLEAMFPSDGLDEELAESGIGYYADAKQVALLYRPAGIVQCPADFETIASILQSYQAQGKNKVVMVTVIGQNGNSPGWTSTTPSIPNLPPTSTDPSLWYHKVPVCDFGLINGQKVLAIDNSWGTLVGNQGQQFLTEAYAPYIYGGIYTLDPSNIGSGAPPVQRPTHAWTTPFGVGATGPDVLALQQALQSLGMFPVNSIVAPTGSYFGITKQAVETFQAAFGIAASGSVDEATIAQLNKIFGA